MFQKKDLRALSPKTYDPHVGLPSSIPSRLSPSLSLMARKPKNKGCYFCGKPAISREHIPPKQVFSVYPCDKITVDSCYVHNNDKNTADDSVVRAMLMSLDNTSPAGPRHTLVVRAIESARRSFPLVKRTVSLISVEKSPTDIIGALAHLAPTVRIDDWVVQVTAGLVYDATKFFDKTIRWDSALFKSANYIPQPSGNIDFNTFVRNLQTKMDGVLQSLEELPWESGWPSGKQNYPAELYTFCFHFAPAVTVVRHTFFDAYAFYVGFESSLETRRKLIQKVRESTVKHTQLGPH
jgi:hypothetical protein